MIYIPNSHLLSIVVRFGLAGKQNVQGEEVKKLDVLANELFINMIRSSYNACLMISEENDEPVEIEFEKQVTFAVRLSKCIQSRRF